MGAATLTIYVLSGSGTGRTELSAFDAALNSFGVSNYNLIPLSSIIPPNSKVVEIERFSPNPEEFGNRLYIVKAEQRSSTQGDWIGAGVGWYQYDDERGLFVEHETVKHSEVSAHATLENLITSSIQDLCKFRNIPFYPDKIRMKIEVTDVREQPACVLVFAVYKSENW